MSRAKDDNVKALWEGAVERLLDSESPVVGHDQDTQLSDDDLVQVADYVFLDSVLKYSFEPQRDVISGRVDSAFETIRREPATARDEAPQPASPASRQYLRRYTDRAKLFAGRDLSKGLAAGLLYLIVTIAAAHYAQVGWFLAKDDNPNTPSAEEQGQEVATMTDWRKVRWQGEDHPKKRNPRLKSGQRLALESGFVEIEYDSGTIVILEGPAEYEVLTGMRGRLELGRLTARMPAEASKGFTVETATVSVEDLGTEFGVEVDETGRGSLHVFDGLVKIYGVGEHATSVETQQIAAGSAAKFGPSVPVTTATFVAEHSRFTRALPGVLTSADLAELFKNNECVAHWSFETIDGDTLKNEIADTHHAKLVGKVDIRTAGKNSFAEFAPGGVGSFRVEADPRLDDIGDQLTLMAWVKARDNGAIIHKWAGRKGYTLEIHNDRSGFVLGEPIMHHLAPPEPLPYGRWVHLAGTYDGRTMRLYQNGREVAHHDVPPGTKVEPFDGHMALGMRSDNPQDRPFTGQPDEAVVLRKALTAEQIETIYEAYRNAR